METVSRRGKLHRWLSLGAVLLACTACATAVSARDADDNGGGGRGPAPKTVPKAVCGSEDHPETALQGQVPASLRASGFKGFNCNLRLISQSRGDGANWQTAEYRDRTFSRDDDDRRDGRRDRGDGFRGDTRTRVCGYHGTAFTTANRTNLGVRVLDLSNPAQPTPTTYLTTTAMLDPWESLKVNERRRLLAANNGHNGGAGPEVDVYDLSSDCRY